ncbi:MAG: hypothetical protein HKN11_08690 [Rhizobiales bacterium]|nr:hypothetical protein [Hyphomicrobiales bacterium]
MIFLHIDNDAQARVHRVASEAGGDVLGCDLKAAGQLDPDIIAKGIAGAADPKMIVVLNAKANNRDARRAFEGLRRIAKFRGLDVHIAGDRSVEHVADQIVQSDADLTLDAPGSSVGEQITKLVKSETMTPLERAEMDIPTVDEAMAATGCSRNAAKQQIDWMKAQSVWANNLYQVNVEYLPNSQAHVIIRRLDRQPVHNWSHFQEIKNQVLGKECEAVEIYPRESALVDAKDHYHLWGFRTPEGTFNLGFKDRDVAADKE